MSEIKEIPEKPTGVPRYYTLRGIKKVPGHDWQLDETQNIWVWKAAPEESAQFETAERDFGGKFTRVAAKKEDYGAIYYKGEPKTVWEDSKGNEWIEDYDTHTRHYLKEGWWRDPSQRKDATKAIKESKITEFETRKSFWKPKIPEFSLPELKIPKVKVGLPAIDAGGKAIIGIALLFIAGIVLLLAVGYSGLGESAGRVGEKEYSRKRK